MQKVIAHTILAPGHVYPFIAVLRELQQRNVHVKLCVSTEQRSVPRAMGGVRLQRVGDHPVERVPTELGRRAAERIWLRNLARTGAPSAAQLAKTIAVEHPDLVLVDPILWGSMAEAEASGIPWGTLAHNPLTIRGLTVDVRGPGCRPARGLLGRFRDRVLDAWQHASFAESLTIINSFRLERGLSPLDDARDRYLTPPLIIAATAEPFEYPRTDWPSSIRFVGPLLWEPVSAESWHDGSDDRPLVLLVGSTVEEYGDGTDWVSRVLVALTDTRVRIVATMPTDRLPQVIPKNATVRHFVPHSRILPRAACVICHGGYGITSKALAAGVPVLAIPLALDRFEVARRVEVAQAGTMLTARQLSSRRIQTALRTTMERRAGAERVARVFRNAGGAAAACDAIIASAHSRTARAGALRFVPRFGLPAGRPD